jgi:hypothetical protein
MTRTALAALAVHLVLVGYLHLPTHARAAAIRYCESNAEPSVSVVSDQTLQVLLASLDEKGNPRVAPSSTAFLAQKLREKFRRRELGGSEEVQVGKLRVVIQAVSLTITEVAGEPLRQPNGARDNQVGDGSVCGSTPSLCQSAFKGLTAEAR